MSFVGRLGERIRETERYMSRRGLQQLDQNRHAARRVLRIEDPLSRVGQHRSDVEEMLALTATHAGHTLRLAERVTIKIVSPPQPIDSLGFTTAPGIRCAQVGLHGLFEKHELTADDRRKSIDLLTNSGIPLRELSAIGPGKMQNPLIAMSWLERVLVAEFAHVADFLGRNGQGELNALQTGAYLLDPLKRQEYREHGFSLNFFPGLHTSLAVAETVDAQMQSLLHSMEGYLPHLLLGFFSDYFFGVERLSNRTLTFQQFLQGRMNRAITIFARMNFLDFGWPYIPALFGLPNPHFAAARLADLCNIKALDWWVRGYLRGDRSTASYRIHQRTLLLMRLADIHYRLIREGSDRFQHTCDVGSFIAAALYLEAHFREKQFHDGVPDELAQRIRQQTAEEESDFLHNYRTRSDTFFMDLDTELAQKEVLLYVSLAWNRMRFERRELIAWTGDRPSFRTHPIGRRIQQIAATGTLEDLRDWMGEFLRAEGELFRMRNPLLQAALTLRDAVSPGELEHTLRELGESVIHRLPRHLAGRDNAVQHIRAITSFEDEGWTNARSPDETERIWTLVQRQLTREEIRRSRAMAALLQTNRTPEIMANIQRDTERNLRPLFHTLDS